MNEVWIVERVDRNSDDTEPLGFTTDPQVASEYAARLDALLPRGYRARCYPMPLLTASPEPFIGYHMVYEVYANGGAERTNSSTHLLLALDASFAGDYPVEPNIRVWEPGEDGTASGREVWRIIGRGHHARRLEHGCRLEVLKILQRGRTEEGHWHDVNEHDCPECGSRASHPCLYPSLSGGPRQAGLGFHLARVEAMKQEARRRQAIWAGREMPLWIEVKDPNAHWWEVGMGSGAA